MQQFFSKLQLTKKQWYIAAAVIAAGLVYHFAGAVINKPQPAESIPYVRTVTAGTEAAQNYLVYPGEVRGRYESNLAFQVSGKIISRNVNLGDEVHAGDVLMEIDPRDIEESVNAARAGLASANANFLLASDNEKRYRSLLASGAVSQAVYDQYSTQLKAAQATLEQAEAQMQSALNQLNYTRLTAGHDGVISSISGEVGQVAAAGTPVITLVRKGEKEVRIYIPENNLADISAGQSAQITFWALPDVAVSGHIREIAPMADPVTRTYQVCVAIENMPPQVQLGMTAKVHFNDGSENMLILPKAAIYQTDDTPQVWIVKNSHVELVPVEIAGYENNSIIIKSGVQNGDVIVTGGAAKLTQGQEVRLEGDAQ